MNTFRITFKNREGKIITEEFYLNFNSVHSVLDWFEDTFEIRPRSISKH